MDTKKFGYSITPARVIAYDKNDMTSAFYLMSVERTLRSCIGCGSCTGTCTAGALTSFNFRKAQTLFRRGEYANLKKELEKCMLCGKCRMVCPRGINTRKVVVSMSRMLK